MLASKLHFALALLATSVIFFACVREPSDSVDQDKIFTDYELFYNANDDITYARATFRFSNLTGTKLELSDPSEVTFDGDLLSWKPGLAYYEKELAGLVPSGTFSFTDTEGTTYTNTIEIVEVQYPDMLDTINRSGSFELVWQGDPLGADHNITVTANGENEGDAQIFFSNSEGANSIIFPADKLGMIGDGPGMLFLDYRNQPAITDAPGSGGLLTGRYRPVNLEVYFE